MAGQTTHPERESTFHYFSRLPAELRWKIWEHSLPSPRLVSIRCGSDDLGSPSSPASSSSSVPANGCGGRRTARLPSPFGTLSSSPAGCTSPARIPANLHTSHEARREALRHYAPSFGIAHRPGQVFFAPQSDILYFGPRDGFMAAEAQLRTVLTLCDPAELARVERVALNDAVFWSLSSSSAAAPHNSSSNSSNNSTAAAAATAAQGQRMVASSLLVDVLQLLRARLPGLRELVFVPRDENPLYSGDACLVAPAMAQSRLARVVREAMAAVFGAGAADEAVAAARPWDWKIMTLSADAGAPVVYERRVMGWEDDDLAAGEEGRAVEFGNAHGPGYVGGGGQFSVGGGGGRRGGDRRAWLATTTTTTTGRDFTPRISVLQESVRRQFMQMEMGGPGAVPVFVE